MKITTFFILQLFIITSILSSNTLEKADSLYNISAYDQAILYYNKAIQEGVKSYNGYNRAGLILYFKGKYNDALNYFLKATQIAPESSEVWYNLGSTYEELSKRDKAIESLKKAIFINPQYYDAINNLGVIYRRKGQTKLALQTYYKALSNTPADTITWFNIGSLYDDIGKIDSALYYYRLKYYFGFDSTTISLLDTFLDAIKTRDSIDSPIEYFDYVSEIHEGYISDGWYDIASLLIYLEESQLALLSYLKCAENGGECLIEFGEICGGANIRECLSNQGIDADKSPGAMKLMGDYFSGGSYRLWVIAENRNLDSSVVYYTRCSELGGNCWLILYLNAQELGGFDLVIKVMTDLSIKRPDLPYPFSMLGYAYYALKIYDSAIENLNKSISLYKNQSESANDYYQLAKAYMDKGLKDDAIKSLQGAINSRPNLREQILFDPTFDSLSSDEKFLNLMLQDSILPGD